MRIKRPAGLAGDGPKRVTLAGLQDIEPVSGTAEVLAPRSDNRAGGRLSKAEIGQALKQPARIQSIRAYRRTADLVIKWAVLGQISWKDASLGVSAVKGAAELMMTERLLEAAGQHDMEPENHPLGVDGGADMLEADPRTARQVTVERTQGVGQDGNPIDQTKIIITGGQDLAASVPELGEEDDK